MRTCVVGWLVAASVVTFGQQARSQDIASMEGVVISQTTGAPLKNAVVKLEQVQESFKKPVARPMTQQTNEQGRFYFAAVPSGDWELTADRRGFATGRYEASKFNPQGRRITVKPKQQLRDLVLKLIPQSVIAGRILDNDGEPVEGLRVAVLKAGYADGTLRWAEVASATTLDNGEYRVPRVGPGRYLVRCGTTATDSSGIATTYAPRANAVVALVPTDGVRATRSLNSGPRGVFHFTGVPPGEYKLLAWDDVPKEDLENPGFVKRFEDQATPVRLAPSGTASASIQVVAPEENR